MAGSYALRIVFATVALGAAGAQAQTDLNAGMTPPQLFSANCATCHRSPQGLARGRDPSSLANFLRDHYTTRPAIAAALASYLTSVRGQPRQPPTTQAPTVSDQTGTASGAARTGAARPLEKLAPATVERLKSFASDADAAKPSTDAAERGLPRLLDYAGSGVGADAKREAAAAAPRAILPPAEQGLRPSQPVPPPPEGGVRDNDKGAAGKSAVSAPAAPMSSGPPPSSAASTPQSNEDGQ